MINDRLLADCQQIADQIGMAVHVFRDAAGRLRLVTNSGDVLGETITVVLPAGDLPLPDLSAHGLGAIVGGPKGESE